MNFLFVDHILKLNPGKETLGLKKVTSRDTYLTRDEHQQWKLFPCIVGEALGQLCSWNVLKTCDFKFRPVGGVVQEIHIFDYAQIGDTIELESNIDNLDEENRLVNFSGVATVKGKKILAVQNSLAPLMPLDEFNFSEKVKSYFTELCQPVTETQQSVLPNDFTGFNVQYDKVITWNKAESVTAETRIAVNAPYFADHFPKKPVFPLSLLMEYNLKLASDFLKKDFLQEQIQVKSVKKIKISQFILPDETMTTVVTLKNRDDHLFLIQFRNEVNNKRVCVAEAEFECKEK